MRASLVSLIVLSLLATACSGNDDGDLDAYCTLLRQGVGFGSSEGTVDSSEYEQLAKEAPPEIRDTVKKLVNATRGLEEISDLDELFGTAFDPDAQAARDAFDAFAVSSCSIDAAALPDGRVDSSEDLVAEVDAYVEKNFGSESWAPKVRYRVERDNGELSGLTVSFVVDPDSDEALSLCNALRPYLYEIRGAQGAIEVIDGDLVLARSDGPDSSCSAR